MKTIEEIRRANLKALQEQHGSLNNLAAALERSASQVSQWTIGVLDSKTGKRRGIHSKSAREIERLLGLPSSWMDSDHDTSLVLLDNASLVRPSPKIPLINLIAAGKLKNSQNLDLNDFPKIDLWKKRYKPTFFALQIEGDSMTTDTGQSFPEGTIVVFDTDRSPKAGDYVVAVLGSDSATHAATFKQLMTDGVSWWLKALNPQHKIIEIDDPQLRITAVAVEWHTGGLL